MPYCALGCAWIGEDEENLHCGPVSFQTPEEPVLEGSPLALSIYFNPKYEKKKKHQKINTQPLLGFLGATETKLSHWTVVRIYDDG